MSEISINTEPKKTALPPIKLTWADTTAPQRECTLPIEATLTLENASLRVDCVREGSLAADERITLLFSLDQIVGVSVCLRNDVAADADWQWVSVADLSYVTIRHKDPFDIVPYFESTFTTGTKYHLLALIKGLSQHHVKVEIVEQKENPRRSLASRRSRHET